MDLAQFLVSSISALANASSETFVFLAPLILGFIFWKVWIRYVRADFISNLEWELLEIKLPKEVYKSPQAMEFVFSAFDQTAGEKPEQWWKGRVPAWFSLEIVSIDGTPHFFIRTQVKPRSYKDIIQTRLYSQFPDIEITEAPDYTKYVSYGKKGTVGIFGSEFVLAEPDPLPIKTYVEYGMDREFGDEKQRIDPITPLLEFLGSLGPGEQAWVQILVQVSKRKYYKKKDGKMGDWREEGKDYVEKLIHGEKKEGEEDKYPSFFRLTKIMNDRIASIERNMTKMGFDCGMRVIYLAEPGKFNVGNIPPLLGAFKQFAYEGLNSFRPAKVTALDFPWDKIDEFMGSPRTSRFKRILFNSYIRRSFFHPPYQRKPFVLTAEELATIFHIPSAIAETPTLRRMESKKTEPPTNLPA